MKSVHGVLNIKPISSLMKCKYYGESLNWNTERKGVKGGSDSLFQVFTFRLQRLGERSAGRGKKKVRKFMWKCKREGSLESVSICGTQVNPGGSRAPEDEGLSSNKPIHAALTAAKARRNKQNRVLQKNNFTFLVRLCGHGRLRTSVSVY